MSIVFLRLFFALVVQSLIEQQVLTQMKTKEITTLSIYPERGRTQHLPAEEIMDFFVEISILEL